MHGLDRPLNALEAVLVQTKSPVPIIGEALAGARASDSDTSVDTCGVDTSERC